MNVTLKFNGRVAPTGSMTAQLGPRAFAFKGSVKPPADMIAAARKSLSPDQFERLMRETGNQPPTPAQLCAAKER